MTDDQWWNAAPHPEKTPPGEQDPAHPADQPQSGNHGLAQPNTPGEDRPEGAQPGAPETVLYGGQGQPGAPETVLYGGSGEPSPPGYSAEYPGGQANYQGQAQFGAGGYGQPQHPGQAQYSGQTPHPGQPQFPGQPQSSGQPQFPGQAQHLGQPQYSGQPQFPGQPQYSEQAQHPGQSPFSGQPPYSGQAQYPYQGGYPPPPGGGNKGLLIGLLAAGVVVVLAIVGAVVFAVNRGSSSDEASPVSSTRSSAPRTSGVKAPAPVVPGYRTVAALNYGVAYDVPATWTVAATTTYRIAGTATASDGENYCPGSAYRTVTFISPSPTADLAEAARTMGLSAAKSGYSNSTDATATPPTSLTAKGMNGKAVQVTGTWRPSRPGCTTTTYAVHTFAFTAPSGSTLVLGIVADTGTTGELTPSVAQQILGSVRPL